MSTFIRSTSVLRTREIRRCFACNEMINKGDSAIEWVSECDGSVFSEYVHPGCFVIVENICSDCRKCSEDEGYQEGFIKECHDNGSECKGVKAWLELGKVE